MKAFLEEELREKKFNRIDATNHKSCRAVAWNSNPTWVGEMNKEEEFSQKPS